MVTSVLDALIEAATAVDSKLHEGLAYLIELREKVATFGSADDEDADDLVNELRSIQSNGS